MSASFRHVANSSGQVTEYPATPRWVKNGQLQPAHPPAREPFLSKNSSSLRAAAKEKDGGLEQRKNDGGAGRKRSEYRNAPSLFTNVRLRRSLQPCSRRWPKFWAFPWKNWGESLTMRNAPNAVPSPNSNASSKPSLPYSASNSRRSSTSSRR